MPSPQICIRMSEVLMARLKTASKKRGMTLVQYTRNLLQSSQDHVDFSSDDVLTEEVLKRILASLCGLEELATRLFVSANSSTSRDMIIKTLEEISDRANSKAKSVLKLKA